MKKFLIIAMMASLLVLGWSGVSLAGTPAYTETSAKAVVTPTKVETNPLCFLDGKLCFDVHDRLRFEIRENNFDFDDSIDSVTDDSFLLQRFRIGAAFKPVEWLKFYAQGQDTREFFSDRPNIPGALGAEGDDTFDFRQGYVQIGPKSWNLTAGRQTLAYGDERLIGTSDWNNFGRTFDAAKLHFELSKTTNIDLFASTPAVIDRHSYNQSDLFNGDELHRDLVFSGIYFTTGAVEPVTLDLYVLGLDQARGNNSNLEGSLTTLPAGAAGGNAMERTDFATIGTRIKGDPKKLGGFEFEGEFALQAGTVADLIFSPAPSTSVPVTISPSARGSRGFSPNTILPAATTIRPTATMAHSKISFHPTTSSTVIWICSRGRTFTTRRSISASSHMRN